MMNREIEAERALRPARSIDWANWRTFGVLWNLRNSESLARFADIDQVMHDR
jgi:hypothetical protein